MTKPCYTREETFILFEPPQNTMLSLLMHLIFQRPTLKTQVHFTFFTTQNNIIFTSQFKYNYHPFIKLNQLTNFIRILIT